MSWSMAAVTIVLTTGVIALGSTGIRMFGFLGWCALVMIAGLGFGLAVDWALR